MRIKTETRIYLVDISDMEFEDDIPTSWSDEKFMTEAEKQGGIYSVNGYQKAFNDDNINQTSSYVRFIDVPYLDDNTATVNKLLLASELAELELLKEYCVLPYEQRYDDHYIYVIDNGNEISFTERAQDVFLEHYGKYLELIEDSEI